MRRPRLRSLAGGAAGIAVGVIGGVVATAVSPAAPAPPPGASSRAVIDTAHVPPLLTLPGQPVRLRFALTCAARSDGLPCDGAGDVFIRRGDSGPFARYPLRRGDDSTDGRYFVDVPRAITDATVGFTYYAVLRDSASGATVTVPSGGAGAPQVSMPLRDPATISLGSHRFGDVRTPAASVVRARWGSGAGEVGLAGSRELGYTGPSAFDVGPDGGVDLLDSVNTRIVRFAGRAVRAVPLAGDLRLADFAAEPDGTFDVLDLHGDVRHITASGTAAWTQPVSDRTWVGLAHGPRVLQEPSEQWMPVAANGAPLARVQQADAARPDKPLANGHGVIVDRVGDSELRIAETQGSGRSWRILSGTPLGEVQLVDSHGSGLVVVTHVYTDARDEFLVLVLDGRGLVQSFAVDSGSWTETAPLGRFRHAHGALYRLRTTPGGAAVDRFDLEVPK